MSIEKQKLNQAEAVFGFAAWLSSRKERIIMSSTDDAGYLADLCDEFCKVNDFPAISSNWPDNLIHPGGEIVIPRDER